MSSAQENQNNQEIDLGAVAKSIGKAIKQFYRFIVSILAFFWKFKLISLILFIVGFIGGIYIDVKPKTYEHIAIVAPNFKSVNDTYNKVKLIDSKIADFDTSFFKSIGINSPKDIKQISLKAIPDPFRFVEFKKEIFDLVKLMADDSNINAVIEGDVVSRNYIFHKLSIHTPNKIENRQIIDNILEFLNSNAYYNELKDIQLKLIDLRLQEFDTTLKHIDNILTAFGTTGAVKTKSILIGDNVAVDEVLKLRDRFVYDRDRLILDKTLYDKVVKDVSLEINLRGKETLGGKAKFVLPLFLLGIFYLLMRKRVRA